MTQIRYLLDECTKGKLRRALLRAEPALDLLRVGEPGAPPSGTLDPDVLLFAEKEGRTLVSNDRSSMPEHLNAHFTAGHHTAGVVLMRGDFALRRYVEDLILIWATETTEEWVDRTDYIPF